MKCDLDKAHTFNGHEKGDGELYIDHTFLGSEELFDLLHPGSEENIL